MSGNNFTMLTYIWAQVHCVAGVYQTHPDSKLRIPLL